MLFAIYNPVHVINWQIRVSQIIVMLFIVYENEDYTQCGQLTILDW